MRTTMTEYAKWGNLLFLIFRRVMKEQYIGSTKRVWLLAYVRRFLKLFLFPAESISAIGVEQLWIDLEKNYNFAHLPIDFVK